MMNNVLYNFISKKLNHFLLKQLFINSFKDVLNYLEYGMVDNNYKSTYTIYMEHIHNYLLNEAELNQSHLFPILQQAKHIIVDLQHCENKEKKRLFGIKKTTDRLPGRKK